MIANLVGWVHHKVEKATLGLQIIWHILPSQQTQMSIQKQTWVQFRLSSVLKTSKLDWLCSSFWSHSLRNVHQVSLLLTVNFRVHFLGTSWKHFKKICNSAQAFSINSYRFEVWTSVELWFFCFHKNSCFWGFFSF
jgi:hypothetical protein